MQQQVGMVKEFDSLKGWGWIETEAGKDIFVHQSNILMEGFRALAVGTPVEFSVGPGMNGRSRAVNVRPL
jgi:CspA family cold shock protein